MAEATRATFKCQGCGEELVRDIMHVHCQCGALLWEGDQHNLDMGSLTIKDAHPKPLCAQFSEAGSE